MSRRLYESIAEIYNHLQDDESREIFRLRSLYSMTGDETYFDDYVKRSQARIYIESSSNQKAYIFGCGVHGKRIATMLIKNWCGFVDNNECLWGGDIGGLRVFSPQELPEDATVYLAVKWHQEEIKEQLLNLGIRETQIINIGALLIDLSNKQYFDGDFLPHEKDEVFVDIGCLNGETSKNFIKWCDGDYKHIYCFEGDPHNAELCEQKMSDLITEGKLTVIKKAVAEKNGVTSFVSCSNGCSKIGDGDLKVETVTLDYVLGKAKPTFLKMDIEGGEYFALQGAKEIIKKYHPKLAISVYHLPSDVYDIPHLILSYYPEYKFYLRHYSPFREETVLYAI